MRDIRPDQNKPDSKPGFIPEFETPALPLKPRFSGQAVPVTSISVPAQEPKTTWRVSRKERTAVLVLLALTIIVLVLGAIIFLPKSEIKLSLRTAPLLVEQTLVLRTDADGQTGSLPGQQFTREVSVSGESPVAGTEVIGTKAKGTVNIINRTFDEQKIKEKSRLVTKDGQLFYMLKSVTLPPAQSSAPAQVPVEVEAAVAGSEGNIAPQRLNFAALDSSAQSLVYAEAPRALTEGSGETVSVVTEQDINTARQAASASARQRIEQGVREELLDGWSLIDESWSAELVAFDTEATVGARQPIIAYAAQVKVRVLGYEMNALEQSLRSALNENLKGDYMLFPGPISFTKSISDINWEAGEAKVEARVTHSTIPKLSIDTLKQKLAGRTEAEAKQYLEALPGVKTVEISLAPFWVSSIPRIENRISLDLQPERKP